MNKKILILGGAKCVWADIQSLGEWNYDMAAVNDVGARIDRPLIFWASLHPKKLKKWEERRRKNGFPAGHIKYSNRQGKPLVDITMKDWGGSSGLFAIQVALALGYTEIIIAGIPMDAEQTHYFNKKKEWKEAMHYRTAWVEHKAELIPFVRSCSGWTRELLGGPE